MKYGVISDTHNHNFSAFAAARPDGINSRLQEILDQTWRAAQAVKDFGGKVLFHGGDLFHVRGSVAPSVLNPTLDLYHKITNDLGIRVIVNAGNHDMEQRESSRVGNAVTALERVGCSIVHEPLTFLSPAGVPASSVMVVPWMPNVEALKKVLEDVPNAKRADVDVLLHAPIDGVIPGLPDHGLDFEYLGKLGYRKVFAGHYHHHRDFGNGVVSIGALTHQTWSDVGSKAGFLLVDDDGSVTYQASTTPRFVELKSEDLMDEATVLSIADGNYVRVKLVTGKAADIESTRSFLMASGAKGVTVIAEPPKSTVARTASAVKAGASLEESVLKYVEASEFADKKSVALACQSILDQARSAA